MRIIIIDAKNREVRESNVMPGQATLAALQGIVGGYIERAMELPGGDDLFVNEEGLLGNPEDFFTIEGGHQPFAGNGVIIGHDGEGMACAARTAISDLEVKFFHVADLPGGDS